MLYLRDMTRQEMLLLNIRVNLFLILHPLVISIQSRFDIYGQQNVPTLCLLLICFHKTMYDAFIFVYDHGKQSVSH